MIQATQIKSNMPVVCSKNGQFATVDHMDGASTIKLSKDDKGAHHFIPISWVTKVDDKVHIDRTGEQAMREWSMASPSTSQAAPHAATTGPAPMKSAPAAAAPAKSVPAAAAPAKSAPHASPAPTAKAPSAKH
jgi:hypothetical protein